MQYSIIISGVRHIFSISMIGRQECNNHKLSSHGTHTQTVSVSEPDTRSNIHILRCDTNSICVYNGDIWSNICVKI